MQIVINFSDIDIQDWVEDIVDDTITLKDIFKEELMGKILSRINYDRDVRQCIDKALGNEIYRKIAEYKDDAAIKVIVSQIIEEKMKKGNSFIFLDRYAERVKEVVDEYIKSYPAKIEQAVKSSVTANIEDCLNELYSGSKMREFIDMDKLSTHIHELLKKKAEETNNDTE